MMPLALLCSSLNAAFRQSMLLELCYTVCYLEFMRQCGICGVVGGRGRGGGGEKRRARRASGDKRRQTTRQTRRRHNGGAPFCLSLPLARAHHRGQTHQRSTTRNCGAKAAALLLLLQRKAGRGRASKKKASVRGKGAAKNWRVVGRRGAGVIACFKQTNREPAQARFFSKQTPGADVSRVACVSVGKCVWRDQSSSSSRSCGGRNSSSSGGGGGKRACPTKGAHVLRTHQTQTHTRAGRKQTVQKKRPAPKKAPETPRPCRRAPGPPPTRAEPQGPTRGAQITAKKREKNPKPCRP